jgi:adenylate kinase
VYNLATNPPARPGICDIDGSELIQRPDDEEATVRARMAQQVGPLLDVVDHYRSAGILRTVDGTQPIEDVTAAILGAFEGTAA